MTQRSLSLLAALTLAGGTAGTALAECKPVPTGEKEAPFFKPAFSGQTRICAVATKAPIDVTVVAKGLDKPWSLEPLAGY